MATIKKKIFPHRNSMVVVIPFVMKWRRRTCQSGAAAARWRTGRALNMDWFSPTFTCDRNVRPQGVPPAVKWEIKRRSIINYPRFDLCELDLVRLEKFCLFFKRLLQSRKTGSHDLKIKPWWTISTVMIWVAATESQQGRWSRFTCGETSHSGMDEGEPTQTLQ